MTGLNSQKEKKESPKTERKCQISETGQNTSEDEATASPRIHPRTILVSI